MRNLRKERIGIVTSSKMDKSIVVMVERREKHPVYGKYLTRSSKIHAHDAKNECGMGDTVTVAESRPISKSKSWKLLEIVESAAQV